MARFGKGHPEPRQAELRQKRAKLRAERQEVATEVREAKHGLELVAGRQREALVAQALGRDGESLEAIAKDAAGWSNLIAVMEPRIRALGDADQELGREQLRCVDENGPFYEARAAEASVEAEAAVARALQAIGEAQSAWRVAGERWLVVSSSRLRRGEPEPGHLPSPDIGQAAFRLSRDTDRAPWPGGRRPGEDAETA